MNNYENAKTPIFLHTLLHIHIFDRIIIQLYQLIEEYRRKQGI